MPKLTFLSNMLLAAACISGVSITQVPTTQHPAQPASTQPPRSTTSAAMKTVNVAMARQRGAIKRIAEQQQQQEHQGRGPEPKKQGDPNPDQPKDQPQEQASQHLWELQHQQQDQSGRLNDAVSSVGQTSVKANASTAEDDLIKAFSTFPKEEQLKQLSLLTKKQQVLLLRYLQQQQPNGQKQQGDDTDPAATVGTIPGAPSRPGVPAAPGNPARPTKPIIGLLMKWIEGVLGGGGKGAGIGLIKYPSTVIGNSGLGMMGYGGPYGYDPFGPGQSRESLTKGMPEVNNCYELLETWLRQCASPSEIGAFLETSSATVSGTSKAERDRMTSRRTVNGSTKHSVTQADFITASLESEAKIPGESGQPGVVTAFLELPQSSKDHAAHLLGQILGAMKSAASGAQPGGTRPSDPSLPTKFEGSDVISQIMTGTHHIPGLQGVVTKTLGPDSYNPWKMDGAEPDEYSVNGPEKCSRMLNNYLWKCNLSPL